jgi:arylsulfate sulfotransferase
MSIRLLSRPLLLALGAGLLACPTSAPEVSEDPADDDDSEAELQASAALHEVTADGRRSDALPVTSGALPLGVLGFSVEVTDAASVSPGVTVFGIGASPGPNSEPLGGPFLLGVDEEGEIVWFLDDDSLGDTADRDARLLDDGSILVLTRGGFRVVSASGENLGDFEGSTRVHHDAMPSSDGGWMLLSNEERTLQVDALGGETLVKGDVAVQVDPDGEILWSWSTFDHLDTERFPGQLSTNASGQTGSVDWTHGNSVFHDMESDLVLLSLRHQNQVVAIDRGSSEIAWILGEGGDFELVGDTGWFYSQHNAQLLSDDRVLLYDNGTERPQEDGGQYSRAVLMQLDHDAHTAGVVWSYEVDDYTSFLGGVTELSTGNFLICAGGATGNAHAQLVEVADDQAVWTLEADEGVIYRTRRFEAWRN